MYLIWKLFGCVIFMGDFLKQYDAVFSLHVTLKITPFAKNIDSWIITAGKGVGLASVSPVFIS